jgi:hypothetical protein
MAVSPDQHARQPLRTVRHLSDCKLLTCRCQGTRATAGTASISATKHYAQGQQPTPYLSCRDPETKATLEASAKHAVKTALQNASSHHRVEKDTGAGVSATADGVHNGTDDATGAAAAQEADMLEAGRLPGSADGGAPGKMPQHSPAAQQPPLHIATAAAEDVSLRSTGSRAMASSPRRASTPRCHPDRCPDTGDTLLGAQPDRWSPCSTQVWKRERVYSHACCRMGAGRRGRRCRRAPGGGPPCCPAAARCTSVPAALLA